MIPLRDFFVSFRCFPFDFHFGLFFHSFFLGGGFVVFSFLIWPIEKQLEPAQRRRSSINLLNPGVTKVPKKPSIDLDSIERSLCLFSLPAHT